MDQGHEPRPLRLGLAASQTTHTPKGFPLFGKPLLRAAAIYLLRTVGRKRLTHLLTFSLSVSGR